MKFLKGNTGLILLLFGYLYLLLTFFNLSFGNAYDITCWSKWSVFLMENGLENAYSSTINYPPLFLYILYLFGLYGGSAAEIYAGIYSLKHIVVLFDIAGAILVLFYVNHFKRNVLLILFLIFNIAFFYNTIVWGQVDSIHTFFAFAAILSAYNRKALMSAVLMLLALNMKLQALIFLPLWLIILLPQLVGHWKKLPLALIGCGALQFIIVLPFIIGGNLAGMWQTITGSVDYFPFLSMNAYNLWYLFFPTQDLMTIHDTNTFLSISYKSWGLILFLLSSVVILLPAFSMAMRKVALKQETYSFEDLKAILLSASLITLLFFFLNTQMHERYVHPAILFAGAYALLSHNFIFYMVLSIAYFLNLEAVLKEFEMGNYHTLVFQPWFVAILFAVALIVGVFRLYTDYGKEIKNLYQVLRLPTVGSSQNS